MSLTLDRAIGLAEPSPPEMRRHAFHLSAAGRVLLAVLSGAAGVIHLAMVPSHWGSSAVEGIGFAVTGWAQIVIAVLLLTSPTRPLLRVTMLVNVFAVGVWMISRTWGLPFGAEAGHPHDAQFIDLVCVGIEVALVVLAAWWLEHPAFGREWRGGRLAIFAIAPIAVLALATAALASPSARNHAHDSHGGHIDTAAGAGATAGHVHTDLAASSSSASSGHTHGAPAAATGSNEIVDVNGKVVKGVKAQDVAAEEQPDVPLDAATRAVLAQQLMAAREIALRYPTVADAERGGYHLVGGGFGPGAGAHYIGGGAGFGAFDPAKPPTLIYDGISPTSQVVGLMYLGGGSTAPEGFAGPNDHWHRHSNVCLRGVESLFPADSDVTAAQCAAAGGRFMAITTWMVHAWVVPGWESSQGVFSHENPNVRCADGTFNTDAIGRCQGS
jgi:hypothetical protein